MTVSTGKRNFVELRQELSGGQGLAANRLARPRAKAAKGQLNRNGLGSTDISAGG